MEVPSTKFDGNRTVGAALIHTDRTTDVTKVISACHVYANAPKSVVWSNCIVIAVGTYT